MKFKKEDRRDLLKLADIIEKKDFFDEEDAEGYLVEILPAEKRDGSQFNLKEYFFGCGMPCCAAGHAICEFPERFGYIGCVREKRADKTGKRLYVNHDNFAAAFHLHKKDSYKITDPLFYPDSGQNPKPKEVAHRIRLIVKRAGG